MQVFCGHDSPRAIASLTLTGRGLLNPFALAGRGVLNIFVLVGRGVLTAPPPGGLRTARPAHRIGGLTTARPAFRRMEVSAVPVGWRLPLHFRRPPVPEYLSMPPLFWPWSFNIRYSGRLDGVLFVP